MIDEEKVNGLSLVKYTLVSEWCRSGWLHWGLALSWPLLLVSSSVVAVLWAVGSFAAAPGQKPPGWSRCCPSVWKKHRESFNPDVFSQLEWIIKSLHVCFSNSVIVAASHTITMKSASQCVTCPPWAEDVPVCCIWIGSCSLMCCGRELPPCWVCSWANTCSDNTSEKSVPQKSGVALI